MSRHVTGAVKKSQFCKFDCNFVKTIPQHLSVSALAPLVDVQMTCGYSAKQIISYYLIFF